ncbi:MAG: ABC transporter permease [Candidatus Methanofastidiosia archaeon]|jgi:ABC-2 type transport system permease protein
MRAVYATFVALLKSWMRSKIGIFFSFLFPVMLLIIFTTVFGGGGDTQYVLFVQNFDTDKGVPTELSQGFVDALEKTEMFDMRNLDPDTDIDQYMEENPSFSYMYRILRIPQGFEEHAMNKSITVRMQVTVDTLSFLRNEYAQYLKEDELKQIERGITTITGMKEGIPQETPELVLLTDKGDTAALGVVSIIQGVTNAFSNGLTGSEQVIAVQAGLLEQKELKVVDYYIPGFIAAFIMTNGIIAGTSTISEYRRDGQVKRLAATPLPKLSWIVANILQQTVLAFALTGVMLGLGWVLFGVRAVPDVYALLLIFVGAVAFCSVGMVLGGVIKDVEAASGAGNAIAFPMMFLSGAFVPLEIMPDYMRSIAKLLPLHYFHDGLRKILIYQKPGESVTAFLVLGAFAVVFIGVALKVTKWKEL